MSEQTGVPLAAAAAELGITSEALRMRLKRGTVRGEKRGGLWFVLSEPEQVPERLHTPSEQPTELVVQLRSEVAHLREALAREQAALEREQTASAELRRLLQQQMRPALAEPIEIAAATSSQMPESRPAAAPSTTEPTPERQRRWWRAWR